MNLFGRGNPLWLPLTQGTHRVKGAWVSTGAYPYKKIATYTNSLSKFKRFEKSLYDLSFMISP